MWAATAVHRKSVEESPKFIFPIQLVLIVLLLLYSGVDCAAMNNVP